jgi:hypothetical protein
MATIGRNTHQMTATSGVQHSLGPPPLGDGCGIVPAHRHSHQNGKQSWCNFQNLFCLLLPRRPPGQYGESSCPIAASSGFRSSPGHYELGNTHRIAKAHLQGLQSGPQWRYILLSSSILSSTITVAK